MTLLQSLKAKLQELDNRFSDDIAYRSAFSTVAKRGLSRNETWRGRLVKWIRDVEQREQKEGARQ